MDPISLAVGAGILVFGVLAGHISGRRAAARRRDRPQEPICGCGHHRALHNPDTLRCGTSVEVQLYNRSNYPAGTKWVPCACQRYVGPEPISTLWSPPIAAEETER